MSVLQHVLARCLLGRLLCGFCGSILPRYIGETEAISGSLQNPNLMPRSILGQSSRWKQSSSAQPWSLAPGKVLPSALQRPRSCTTLCRCLPLERGSWKPVCWVTKPEKGLRVGYSGIHTQVLRCAFGHQVCIKGIEAPLVDCVSTKRKKSRRQTCLGS